MYVVAETGVALIGVVSSETVSPWREAVDVDSFFARRRRVQLRTTPSRLRCRGQRGRRSGTSSGTIEARFDRSPVGALPLGHHGVGQPHRPAVAGVERRRVLVRQRRAGCSRPAGWRLLCCLPCCASFELNCERRSSKRPAAADARAAARWCGRRSTRRTSEPGSCRPWSSPGKLQASRTLVPRCATTRSVVAFGMIGNGRMRIAAFAASNDERKAPAPQSFLTRRGF